MMAEKMNFAWGHKRRYNDFGTYMRSHFKGTVQKVSVNAGLTCPNRDGNKGYGGCTFCNNDTFKPTYCQPDIRVKEQLSRGIDLFKAKHPDTKYLAYFQAYTNTYGDISQLIDLYEEALSTPEVIGLIVGTRPDCLPDSLLDYFQDLSKRQYLTVELGIESTSDLTLLRVRRGHDYKCTIDAVENLVSRGILTGAHLILGLPGESRQEMLNHADVISQLPINFLKVHQLQYVKGSILGADFMKNPEKYEVFELDEYIELVVEFITRVRPSIVMERFASQAPYNMLLAPNWKLKNFEMARMVEKRLEELDVWQGKYWKGSNA